jgi:hypothetical protein
MAQRFSRYGLALPFDKALFALSSDALLVPPFEKGGSGGICRPLRWLDPWLNPPQPPFAKGGVPTCAIATRSSTLDAKRAFDKGEPRGI